MNEKKIFSYSLTFFLGVFFARHIYLQRPELSKINLSYAILPLKLSFFFEPKLISNNLYKKKFMAVKLSKTRNNFLCYWKETFEGHGKKSKNINLIFNKKKIPFIVSIWKSLEEQKIIFVQNLKLKNTPLCSKKPRAFYS